MTESWAISDRIHILLKKERVHTLQCKFLSSVPKSSARYACTDFPTQLESSASTQYHRAIHHRLHLPGYHSHINWGCQEQTIALAHCVYYRLHIIVVYTFTISAREAALATVNLLINQRDVLCFDPCLFQARESIAQSIGSIPIFVRACIYSEYLHLTSKILQLV